MALRISSIATSLASVLETALFSAKQVNQRFGVLPETAALESLILEPGKHYRFTTTLTVTLPTITADMDGIRIAVTQFDNACTIRYTINGVNYEHVLTASRNSGGGVTATFVAKYSATATLCMWYLDRDIGRALTSGYVAFPSIAPELQVGQWQPVIVGQVRDDSRATGSAITLIGNHDLWSATKFSVDDNTLGLYKLNLLIDCNYVVQTFLIRYVYSTEGLDPDDPVRPFVLQSSNYGMAYAYHDPATGYFKNNYTFGNIKTIYSDDNASNQMSWGFVAYRVP